MTIWNIREMGTSGTDLPAGRDQEMVVSVRSCQD